MTVAASTRERGLGVLTSAAILLYLATFVSRGWIPHDEGMLGQAAMRVMEGGLPHVDYEEPYTGALSWAYAWLFRARGVDLLNVRWLLFAGAIAATWLLYAILRRYLRPLGAGVAVWVALVWSFPNYFAGLPSWWLLICALGALWSIVRFLETRQTRYVVAAGLAAGLAIVIKQTGVYLFIALILSLCADDGLRARDSPWLERAERIVRWGAAIAGPIAAAAILAPRILAAEGVYLLCPVIACSIALGASSEREPQSAGAGSLFVTILAATLGAALPVACLLVPYIARHRLWDLINGALVLPRKRLEFASMTMPPAFFIVAGAPLLALVFACRAAVARVWSPVVLLRWTLAIALAITAMVSIVGYQIVWQSTRAFGALLPIGMAWRLAVGRAADVHDPRRRTMLFAFASVLAWLSLNQFPFAAPIYFSYTAPLVVIGAIAAADTNSCLRADILLPWSALLLVFAVLVTNRGDVHVLGLAYVPARLETPLGLPRAHLRVGKGDADVYRRLVSLIGDHLRGGRLMAGPDCPEIYYLTGLRNASGSLFDFFAGSASDAAAPWLSAQMVIVNHRPQFSPPLSDGLLAAVRHEFGRVQRIGPFEVRWR